MLHFYIAYLFTHTPINKILLQVSLRWELMCKFFMPIARETQCVSLQTQKDDKP